MDDEAFVTLRKKSGAHADNNVPQTDTAHALSSSLASSDKENDDARDGMNEKFKKLKNYMEED